MAKKKAPAKKEIQTITLTPNVLVFSVLVVVAVGVIAFVAGQKMTGGTIGSSQQDVADSIQQASKEAETPQIEIKPGNPVVAVVDGKEITRLDVFQFIQNLPEQTRRMPLQQLFPLAQQQVINATLINEKTENVKLDKDKEVKRQLAEAKKQIVRNVFIEKEIGKRITEERLKKAYEQYKAAFPKIEEVKASHILVKDKSVAKEVIGKLKEGADFAELAKEYSTDGTAKNGGNLNYFSKTDVVPEFAEASFATEVGTYTTEPVKTEFGYHVIKVEDKRIRPPVEFDKAKPFLESQLRRVAMDEIMSDWRARANVEFFDVNGEKPEAKKSAETPDEEVK